MKIYNLEQGSESWHTIRLGKLTASRFKDVISKGRGKAPSKTRESYLMQLTAEVLTGSPQDSFTSDAMQWGIETEPQARNMYETLEGVTVEQVGFVTISDWVGCSPDGLVGDEGLVEFKCPKSSTQLAYYLAGVFPPEYKAQVQGQLYVTDRKWCGFVSFDPRINSDAHYFKIRVKRDEEYIEELKAGLDEFVNDLTQTIERCKND